MKRALLPAILVLATAGLVLLGRSLGRLVDGGRTRAVAVTAAGADETPLALPAEAGALPEERAAATGRAEVAGAATTEPGAMTEPAFTFGVRVTALEDGRPLPDATVRCDDAEHTTDADGRAQVALDELPSPRGTWIRATAPGRVGRQAVLAPGSDEVDVELAAGRGFTLILIDDATDAPLARTSVDVRQYDVEYRLRFRAETDDAGTVLVDPIFPGRFRVRVDLSDGPRHESWHGLGGASRLVVRVPRLGVVSGTVRWPGGQPAAGVRIEIREARSGRWTRWRTYSDEEGRYRARGLRLDRSYRVAVRASAEVAPGEENREARGESEVFRPTADDPEHFADVALAPVPEASVVVRTRDAEGAPVAGARVTIELPGDPLRADWPRWLGGREEIGGRTDEEGRITLSFRRGGAARLEASIGTQEPVARAVALVVGETLEVEVELDPGLVLTGRLEGPGGEPVGGAWVTFGPETVADPDRFPNMRSDGEGHFEFSGLPDAPGTLRVSSSRTGGGLGLRTRHEVAGVRPGGDEVLVRLPAPAVVRGRWAPPLEEPSMEFGLLGQGFDSSDDLPVAADGRFELRLGVTGAPFDLWLVGEDNETQEPVVFEDLVLAPGEVRDLGELEVTRGPPVAAQAIDSEGRPIAGADVEIETDFLNLDRDGETDEQGAFRLESVPALAGWLSIEADGFVDGWWELEDLRAIDGSTYALARAGRIDGELDGVPVDEIENVRLLGYREEPDGSLRSGRTFRLDAEGSFSVEAEPGSWRVFLETGDGWHQVAEVDVRAGETTRCEIELF